MKVLGVEALNVRAEVVTELRGVAGRMIEIGAKMDYFGGLGPLGIHGRELIGAGRTAASWADWIETEDAHPPSRLCGCAYCLPSFSTPSPS